MGFLDSNPKIYNKIELHPGGLLDKWQKDDWYQRLQPIEQMGYKWDPVDGRMKSYGKQFLSATTPWCHRKHKPSKHCGMDHNLLFNVFGIIHPRCIECWKTVVTPRTFHELLQLEKLEWELPFAAKCGMELRDYTPKFYGGYFYSDSIDEGIETTKIVRDAVAERISPEVAKDVILKRGCTEYEMIKGPSPFWHVTKDEEEFIKHFEAYVEVTRGGLVPQAEFLKKAIRLRWALWAHMNGDMTYTDYNGGKQLFPDYVRYDDKPLDAIKHDLAVSRAVAKEDIDAEVAHDFLVFAQEWADARGQEPAKLAAALGMNESNPLGLFRIKENTPDETKGEHDELI